MNRIIHTGMYSYDAKVFLTNLLLQIHAKAKSRHYRASTNELYNKIVENPDGEVVISIDTDRYEYSRTIWGRNKNDDLKSKQWLAIMLKKYVHDHFGSDECWSRTNCNPDLYHISWLSYGQDIDNPLKFTVADAYTVYDILLNRKNLERKYSANQDILKKIIGNRRDPLKTELEIQRRKKLEDLKNNYNLKIQELENERRAKMLDFQDKVDAEFSEKKRNAKAEYNKAFKEIEDKVNSANSVGSLFFNAIS